MAGRMLRPYKRPSTAIAPAPLSRSPQSRFSGILSTRKAQAMATNIPNSPFQTRVGFLGNPNSADPFKFWRVVPWTDENLLRLKNLGFNTIQVNVAWGPRPDDEPLNLEDVVEL